MTGSTTWCEVADRPLVERLKFMFGSYNAGRTNILRAQQFALGEGLNATLWGLWSLLPGSCRGSPVAGARKP